MRPTDFCLSTLQLRALTPRGFPFRSEACAPLSCGGPGVSRHRCPLRRAERLASRGVFFPMTRRCDRASDTSVASPLRRRRFRTDRHFPGPPRSLLRTLREERATSTTRGAFPRLATEPTWFGLVADTEKLALPFLVIVTLPSRRVSRRPFARSNPKSRFWRDPRLLRARPRPRDSSFRLETADSRFSGPDAAGRILQHDTTREHTHRAVGPR